MKVHGVTETNMYRECCTLQSSRETSSFEQEEFWCDNVSDQELFVPSLPFLQCLKWLGGAARHSNKGSAKPGVAGAGDG